MTELVMELKEYAIGFQKLMACLSISAMVAFVAFTIVSTNELGTAECKWGDGNDINYTGLSVALFVVFFAMIAAVAGAGLVENATKIKKWKKFVIRLLFNEGIFFLTGLALSFTTVSKCPLGVGSNTTAQMDTNFIDEAAEYSGYLILAVGTCMMIHCVAVIVQWYNGGEDKEIKRDMYDNVFLAAEFALISVGAIISASNYDYKKLFDSDGITSADRQALLHMCNSGDNQPFMGLADMGGGKAILWILGILALGHCGVTLVVDVFRLEKESLTMRGAVEPTVQILITLFGMFAVAPLVFVIQNPPCNYKFEKLVHDSIGAMGVQVLVIGFIMFSGTQILKTYRKYAQDAGIELKAHLLG